jgi:predicted RNA binding protein YcfA (HicA-like mRNA interferase family)
MTRLRRDVSGDELAQAFERIGYVVTRQSGSHLRLTTQAFGEHHITIPRHAALRVGTLSSIVSDAAAHLKLERDTLIERLFG